MNYEIYIKPNSRGGMQYWNELWRARELMFFLAWRDIVVKYKHAIIGVLWTVLRPALTTVAFTLVFGKIAKLPSGELPYHLLVLTGVIPWLFFSGIVAEAGTSMINNSSLITKIYFPRLIIPGSIVLANLLDFGISCIFLLAMLIAGGVKISYAIGYLPIIIIIISILSLSVGLWVAALNVKYRDIQFIIPFVITIGQYISPIGYGTAAVPQQWQWLYMMNPMVGVIDGFRWCMLGGEYIPNIVSLLYSLAFSICLLITGVMYFRSVERELVDVL